MLERIIEFNILESMELLITIGGLTIIGQQMPMTQGATLVFLRVLQLFQATVQFILGIKMGVWPILGMSRVRC